AACERAPTHHTLAGAIRAAGMQPPASQPHHGLVLLDTHGNAQRYGYGDLWQTALGIATGLRAHGVQQGDRVLLLLPTSASYVATVCATILLGAVPCTVAAPTSSAKADEALGSLAAVASKLEARLIIAPVGVMAPLQTAPDLATYQIVTDVDLATDVPLDPALLPVIQPSDMLHIQLTSGSTSRPKGVVITHQQALANIHAITRAVDYAPQTESTLVWLPLYHDMGFVQLLLNIYYQSTLYLMTPFSFLRQPLSWLRNMSTYGIAMSAAPTFAYRTCVQKFDPAKLVGVNLATWRRAFVGAEPVPLRVVEEFAHCYAPYGLHPDTIYPCYGMAETVLATTLHQRTPAPDGHGFLQLDQIDKQVLLRDERALPVEDAAEQPTVGVLSMGQAVQGLDLAILSADGQPCADRAVGEICVRGPSVMQHYVADSAATAQALQDGWYHTGDRGYLVAGDLYVLGRIKELVIVRGRNYQPYDIEALLEQHPAVRTDYTVVFSLFNEVQGTDDVVAIIESKATPETHADLTNELQQSLQRVFGFRAHEIVIVPHGTIPRTTSGKRQRTLCREFYRTGAFARQQPATRPAEASTAAS
ncbi:MAG TPA: AMP-binding protein, partial [Herpetosiphonaceae bacterium]